MRLVVIMRGFGLLLMVIQDKFAVLFLLVSTANLSLLVTRG